MIDVGIEKIAYATPHYYLDLKELAAARNVDEHYYIQRLGQAKMAVAPPGQDIVSLGANAAELALQNIDTRKVAMVLFATESGVDQSKSAGIFIQKLLNLPNSCRVVELKQACYSATCGIRLALPYLRQYPDQKVLLIASDIARYGLNTTGESSQGAGAVAMVLSAQPSVAVIEPECGYATHDAMDFWRPNYRDEAIVDGQFSCALYLKLLKQTYSDYSADSNRQYQDHDAFLYHIPLPKLVENAHRKLSLVNGYRLSSAEITQHMKAPLHLAREIGNCYTASLYLSLISLLDQTNTDMAGQRVGLYSYGSGAVAEYFSIRLSPGYQNHLPLEAMRAHLNTRTSLTVQDYENWYQFRYVEDGSRQEFNTDTQQGPYRLSAIDQHIRHYEKVSQ